MESDEQIDSISDLVNQLKEAPLEKLHTLLNKLNVSQSELDKYGKFSSENYTRHSFVETDEFELILMCWDKGQCTAIHDHGGQNCWVKVVSGDVQENRYRRNVINGNFDLISSDLRLEGQMGYINDNIALHTISAPNQRSMTVHLYANPIKSCKVFNEDGTLIEEKHLEPDTVGVLA